jgi:hypothetical protein
MALSPYLQKSVLDWVCGGATATRPAGRWIGLADANGSEVNVNDYARRSIGFGEAFASATMLAAMTMGPYALSANISVHTLQIYDASVSGNLLLATALATPHTVRAPAGGVIVARLAVMLS